MCDWRSLPNKDRHKGFLEKFSATLIEYTFDSVSRDNPVSRWREPDYLRDIIKFELNDEPESQDGLIKLAAKILRFSVKTGHPRFMNQLFSGLDPYGLAAQWLTDTLNASVYTYEVAPVLTLMEKTLIIKLLRMFYKNEHGCTDESESIGDGMFCPGGSFANGSAINLARYWFMRQAKQKNIRCSKLTLFASEDAHYSILKWASLCGIENILLVKTDESGKMDVNDLRERILEEHRKGNDAFMVSATAGTTVLGAFDPLNEIADVCQEFRLWFHVDAAWGGGLIFSGTHNGLLRGIERADSITFNPHKLLAVPQQCTLLLTRHHDVLHAAHSKRASYLFQTDKFYPGDLDAGDKYLQCGRRPDAVKLWFMWQAKGTAGFENHVNHLMHLSALFKKEIDERDGFELVAEPSFINVCFWFVPVSLRNKRASCGYKEKLNKIAPKLKENMTKRGSLMINYQPLREKPNFFRFVVQNSGVDAQDIYYIFKEFENLGETL